jgi:hypothetical protein
MKYVISRFFKFTYILNNNNNKYLHIYTQFLTNIQENETTTIDHFYLNN